MQNVQENTAVNPSKSVAGVEIANAIAVWFLKKKALVFG